jgi:hypothetical protein
LFLFFAYLMLIGSRNVYRIYSYLALLKILASLPTAKFRLEYLPAIFVMSIYTLFAMGTANAEFSLRYAVRTFIDIIIVFQIVSEVTRKNDVFQRFLFVLALGGIASGIYGMVSGQASEAIIETGTELEVVERLLGAIPDANFVGYLYDMSIIAIISVKGIKPYIRLPIMALLFYFLAKAASISAFVTLCVVLALWLILRFKGIGVVVVFGMLVALSVSVTAILTMPALRENTPFSGLVIRINDKLVYLQRGDWDMVSTERTAVWRTVLSYYRKQPFISQLFGGNVVTTDIVDHPIFKENFSCHNSILQGLLDFGLVGTLIIFVNFFVIYLGRIVKYLHTDDRLDVKDMDRARILFLTVFFLFGLSVDYFVQWSWLMFFFF